MGGRASSLAYPLLVVSLTGSASETGLVVFCSTLPELALYIPLAPLVDRWDWRRTMLFAELGRGVAIAALFAFLVFGDPSFFQVASLAFLESSLGVLYQLSEQRAIQSAVPPQQVAKALAANETRTHSAVLLGRSLSGTLFSLWSAAPFLFDAISRAVSIIAILLTRGSYRSHKNQKFQNFFRELTEGFKWVWGDGLMRRDLALTAGICFCAQMFIVTFVAWSDHVDISSLFVGLVIAMSGIGGVAGGLVANFTLKRVGYRVLLIQPWLWVANFLSPSLSFNLNAAAICIFLTSVIGAIGNVAMSSYVFERAPSTMLARVSSVRLFSTLMGAVFGPLFGGFLTARFGFEFTAGVIFATMFAIAVWATSSRTLWRTLGSTKP